MIYKVSFDFLMSFFTELYSQPITAGGWDLQTDTATTSEVKGQEPDGLSFQSLVLFS